MAKKYLADDLKIKTDRFLNVSKKESDNILKLLKKTKRTFLTKYKKGLISKQEMLKIFDKVLKYLDDLENKRLQHLNDLVLSFKQKKIENNCLTKCNVTIDRMDDIIVNNTKELLIKSVEEEIELDKTITEENDIKSVIVNENTMEIDAILEDLEEGDATVENMEVDEIKTKENENCVQSISSEVVISLTDLVHESSVTFNSEKESNKSMEGCRTFDNIEDILSDEVVSAVAISQDLSLTQSSEKLIKPNDITAAVKENNNTMEPTIIVQEHLKTPSNDSSVEKTTSKTVISSTSHERGKTPSSASSLSNSKADIRTLNNSGLFKSKFHRTFSSSQKVANKSQAKPQISSALKRPLAEVKRQKELIEEDKHQIMKQRAEQQELRFKKMNELKKHGQNAIQLVHARANVVTGKTDMSKRIIKSPISSKKDILKTNAVFMKDNSKNYNAASKESSKIVPLSSKETSKIAGFSTKEISKVISMKEIPKATVMSKEIPKVVIVPSSTSSSSKTISGTTVYSNTLVADNFVKPVLKPINKELSTIVANNGHFKTPIQRKSKPMLSESCRKIVVDHHSYSLADLDSDVSDDDDVENQNNRDVPSWTDKQRGTLGRLSEYHAQNTDVETVFLAPTSLVISIPEVFGGYNFNIKKRSSSAVWDK